jgi:hypothetical protein
MTALPPEQPPQIQADQPFTMQPPYPAPQQPAYSPQFNYPQFVRAPSNGLATASLVLGIIGGALALIAVATFWAAAAGVTGFLLGLLAAIFGGVGLQNARRVNVGRSAAKAGVILGCVTMIVLLATLILSVVIIAIR